MTISEIVLTAVCALLVVITSFALRYGIKIHKNVDSLTESIDDFIEGKSATDFSTEDNHFARLQNSVSDLENLYQLEQNNTAKESKKNAEFIADISHQLKTPLAALRLYAEMTHRENPSSYTEKELQLIDRMENLIFELLRLEKIRSDSYVMDFEFQDIADTAKQVADEFKVLFPNKTYIVRGSSFFRFDKTWMREAISNVVKNAGEHTPTDGRVEIIIEDSEKSTSVFIKDNGTGVPEEELSKLFIRFHKTANASPNSAGIGLAITKVIVEKHHGTITAENTAEGFAIVICIPHIDGNITI